MKDVHAVVAMVGLVCDAFEGYEKAMANDGKLGPDDIAFFLPLIQEFGPALKDVDQIIPEIKAMGGPELDALLQAIDTKVPELRGKIDLFKKIEAVLKMLVAIKECYQVFQDPVVDPAVGQPSAG